MALKTTKTRAAAALDAILTAINNAGSAGYLRIYSGSAPADLATSETGTLLAQCPLIDGAQNAFGATSTTTLIATGYVSGGKWAEDTSVNATGTAGYFRVYTQAGTAVLQGSVGTSGTDLILDTTSITTGGTLVISYMNITIGNIT